MIAPVSADRLGLALERQSSDHTSRERNARQWVETSFQIGVIGQSVAVGVGPDRVGADDELGGVVQAVLVGVGATHLCRSIAGRLKLTPVPGVTNSLIPMKSVET